MKINHRGLHVKEGRDYNIESYAKQSVEYCLSYTEKREGKVLDIGADYGFTSWLFQKVGFEVDAFDANPRNLISEIHVEKGDWNDMSKYKDNDYDIVFLNHCLEHEKNPYQLIENIRKKLKDNGIFFVAVPHIDSEYASIIELGHISFFNKVSLSNLIKYIGFEILDTDVKEFRKGFKEVFVVARKKSIRN